MGNIQQKKQFKRQALLDAAYDLFLELGPNKTSVGNIASRANVAKGTFYLYFSDKDAILRALLGRISYRILEEACNAADALGEAAFSDKVLAVVDYIIEYLRKETLVLRLVQRNMVWPSLEDLEADGDSAPLVQRILTVCRSCPELADRDEREIYQRVAALVSMCTTMCYSCIIEKKPDTIDNMKPVLYDIICKSL